MHIGMASIFQNPEDHIPDADVYRAELRLADLAEPLGFDSIWSVKPEQISMLDHLCDGRLILGLGRGAGRTEQALPSLREAS